MGGGGGGGGWEMGLFGLMLSLLMISITDYVTRSKVTVRSLKSVEKKGNRLKGI